MAKNVLYLASLLLSLTLTAQNVDFENSILVKATVDGDALLLDWPNTAGVSSYFIKKREKGQTNYKPLVSLPGTATSFRDTNVVKGKIYEYHITRQNSTSNVAAPISAGIEVSPVHFRGGVLMVIETSLHTSLSAELDQYESDLWNEGWTVSRIWVHSQATADSVKQVIKAAAQINTDMRAVVLIGKVPVPYSGYLAPDGHTPDHLGAWPADVFYGDLDGTWTDNSVNVTGASGTRNDNIPGDGKYDNSSLPGKVELEVGRIDLSDLPAFGKTEVELLQQYFAKNHAFRSGAQPYVKRGLIQNNFGSYAEAFGQSGLNNFVRFFGRDSVKYLPYKTTLQQDQYLCSYGCGAGNYQGASGIGSTSELVNENHQTIFTMLFGSYFGDWHNTNNYLRAALASGQTLTNCWAGRPVWHIHHMAVGETIGYGTKISQNNSSEFPAGNGATGVHVALMGDPTLTLLPYHGIDTLYTTIKKDSVYLQWESVSPDNQSYYVYQKNDEDVFELLTQTAINENRLSLSCVKKGINEFLVRPVRLETTGSGSFYNLGEGKSVMATIDFDGKPQMKLDYSLYYEKMDLSAQIIDGTFLSFNPGDGRLFTDSLPGSIVYQRQGIYNACFKLQNQCTTIDTCIQITVESSSPNLELLSINPRCHDQTGMIFIGVLHEVVPFTYKWSTMDTTLSIGGLASGKYFITITTATGHTEVYDFTITIPDPITASIEVFAASPNENNGKIIIDQLHGWNFKFNVFINDVDYGSQLVYEGLAPGDYTIEIIDGYYCKLDTSITVGVLNSTSDSNRETALLIQAADGSWKTSDPIYEANISIRVYDLTGKLLRNTGFKELSMYIYNELPPGIYLVEAKLGHRHQTLKWINMK